LPRCETPVVRSRLLAGAESSNPVFPRRTPACCPPSRLGATGGNLCKWGREVRGVLSSLNKISKPNALDEDILLYAGIKGMVEEVTGLLRDG
jgi:hypothetical protein